MARSKKLEIIYYNGRPDGVRSVRRHLSTITTYVIGHILGFLNPMISSWCLMKT